MEAASSVTDRRAVSLITLCVLSLIVGGVTGLGAVALRALMALFHNVAFSGVFSFVYEANLPTPPSPWGALIIFVPVIGGAIVVFMVQKFAPEARGHGVPEVMDAIYYKNGIIRPVVVVIKSLASALSIGTGASVGREGPIIQIGSGIGSALGQIWRLSPWQTITLVAAGGGAGIAATFNTPLGAVMFAVELLLPELSARTFLPVVLATGTATYVGRIFFGLQPSFQVPKQIMLDATPPLSVELLPAYLLLGLLCGVASAGFVRLLHLMEDAFDAIPGNAYSRNAIGMFALGVLIYGMYMAFGHYHVEGVGYSTIQAILGGDLNVAWMLAALFAAKLLATTLSLGSGASGGIFSPSLFLGATLGGSFGAVAAQLFPNLGLSAVPFAIVGMAAVVGGGTGAAMTAILMIFEMTRDYSVTVPSIIAVASAIGMRRVLSVENIYTLKLARRGHYIPKERHSHMFLIRHARDVMTPVVGITPAAELSATAERRAAPGFGRSFRVVADGRHVAGVIAAGDDGAPIGGAPVIRDFTVVRHDDFLQAVIRRMGRRGRRHAVVVQGRGVPRPETVIGVITPNDVAGTIMKDFAR